MQAAVENQITSPQAAIALLERVESILDPERRRCRCPDCQTDWNTMELSDSEMYESDRWDDDDDDEEFWGDDDDDDDDY